MNCTSKKGTKGMKAGGSTGMHRMPDGGMMKDSAHKGMKAGGTMKYKMGGSVDGCATKGKTRGTIR